MRSAARRAAFAGTAASAAASAAGTRDASAAAARANANAASDAVAENVFPSDDVLPALSFLPPPPDTTVDEQ